MSKKDYIEVAAAIQRTKDECREILGSYSVIRIVAGRVADAFEKENPHFERVRFLTACGFPPEVA